MTINAGFVVALCIVFGIAGLKLTVGKGFSWIRFFETLREFPIELGFYAVVVRIVELIKATDAVSSCGDNSCSKEARDLRDCVVLVAEYLAAMFLALLVNQVHQGQLDKDAACWRWLLPLGFCYVIGFGLAWFVRVG